MWFTEATTYRNPDGTINLMYSEIGTIDPTTHMVTEFEIPTGAAEPLGIAVGPEGNIWFTENGNSAVGVLTPTLDLVATGVPTAQVALGAAFGMTISVVYHGGPVDTGFDGEITLALADPGPLGASLGGPLTATAHAGVATFTGLTLDRPGTYGIVASPGPHGPDTTVAVTIATSPTSGAPPTSGGSPTTAAPPTIVAAAPVFAGRGRHKRLNGFELDFSTEMDPARADDAAEYSLVQLRRHGRRLSSRPVGLRASYDEIAHRVTLTLIGRPKFAAGGKLMVAGGLVDAAGAPLDGGVTFVIARKGKGLSR
jgi:hypothetical protein